MTKLIQKETATIYSFEKSENGETTVYRIECIDGIVSGMEKRTVEYFDDGDAENGPSLGSTLSAATALDTSIVWFERDLEAQIDELIKDAEAYTTYCMMRDADYSAAVYGDSQ